MALEKEMTPCREWQERNMLAGGGGHCDDLDDALATFDKLCGRKPQQSTLF